LSGHVVIVRHEEDTTVDRVTAAVELFSEGHACSQAVVIAHADDLGLDHAQAARIAAGFAAGMRVGGVCGAATGALMVLGLALCDASCVEPKRRATIATATSEFMAEFRERCGALDCTEIIGYDLSTPEGLRAAKEQGLFASVCAPVVRHAAEILEEMLAGRSTP
jgi:C_GCAxxG_C_C family probable redox protein